MSKYIIDSSTLTDIADAIRDKAVTTEPIDPVDMPQKILDIQTDKHFATIGVSTDSFMGEDVTVSSAELGYTQTKVFDALGNADFVVNDWGTYTVECNGKTAEVVVSEWYQTYNVEITSETEITFLVEGAKGDNITIKNEGGEIVRNLIFSTSETSQSVTLSIPNEGAEFLFESSNSDNSDGTATKMSKWVHLTPSTTNVKVMPNGALLWGMNEIQPLSVYAHKSISSPEGATYLPILVKNDRNANVSIATVRDYDGKRGIVTFGNAVQDMTGYMRLKMHITNAVLYKEWALFRISAINSIQDNFERLESVIFARTGNTEAVVILNNAIVDLDITNVERAVPTLELFGTQGETNTSKITNITFDCAWLESVRSLPETETDDVTLTIEGAKADKITVYDKYGEVVEYIDFDAEAVSKSVTLKVRKGGETLKFVSSVAKDTTEATKNFYKVVDVTTETTEVKIMPDGLVLYWYGNECVDVTGGWSIDLRPEESNSYISLESSNMLMHGSLWSARLGSKIIDFSKYSKINMLVDHANTRPISVGVWKPNTWANIVVEKTDQIQGDNRMVSCDIANNQYSDHYIGIRGSNTANTKIRSVWLE